MTDRELFQKLKEGDEKALEYVYLNNRSKSIRFASRRLYRNMEGGVTKYCSMEEAIDLYHESILVVVENIREGRLVNLRVQFSTYLIATMKNKWLSKIREKRMSLDQHKEEVSWKPEEENSLKLNVRKALLAMDEKCREMLTLRYFMEWDYEDIAARMKYNKGDVVRNLISRCRAKFKSLVISQKNSSPHLSNP